MLTLGSPFRGNPRVALLNVVELQIAIGMGGAGFVLAVGLGSDAFAGRSRRPDSVLGQA